MLQALLSFYQASVQNNSSGFSFESGNLPHGYFSQVSYASKADMNYVKQLE